MPVAVPARGGPHAQTSTPAHFQTPEQRSQVAQAKRNRSQKRKPILGITRPAIRRMARRGGVKRISATVYDETRTALRERLTNILRLCFAYVELRNTKTITVDDVFHSLRRMGQTIYGFDVRSMGGAVTRRPRRSPRPRPAPLPRTQPVIEV